MKKTANLVSRWNLLLAAVGFTFASSAFAAPVTLAFKGALEDGGLFLGYVTYGDQDREGVTQANPTGVEGFGRYLGGLWHIDIKGGTTTQDAQLDNLTGGRVPVETRETPELIAMYMLGPQAGELPRLSLLFQARDGYDADIQPTRADIVSFFFQLTVGATTVFSEYQDRLGHVAHVTDIEFVNPSSLLHPPAAVPVPGALGLMVGALGLFVPALRRRSKPTA